MVHCSRNSLPSKEEVDQISIDELVNEWLAVVHESLGPCPTGRKHIADEQYYQLFCQIFGRVQATIKENPSSLTEEIVSSFVDVTRVVYEHYNSHGTLWKINQEKYRQLIYIAEFFNFDLVEKAVA
jgi:hypothetical protein